MKTDNRVNSYISIVLNEASQELEAQGAKADLFARLAKVADILCMLTAYKSLALNISMFLDEKSGVSCQTEIQEYANTLRQVLQKDISELAVAAD